MTYSKVTSIKHKTEITPSEYEKVMNTDYVKGYEDLKWLLAILWNTGMRIGRPSNYVPKISVLLMVSNVSASTQKMGSRLKMKPLFETYQ